MTSTPIGGMLGGGGIQGSDVNVEGTVNISGNSIWGARMDLTRHGERRARRAVGICAAARSPT